MPCVECETRDEDRGHGGAVFEIHYEFGGETWYTCLSCALDEMSDRLDIDRMSDETIQDLSIFPEE